MEEDVGVKATTRLRRRMSVEQSEDGSSPAPSTPTKKRGGRLAAKPQLELIDENTPVSSPRNTRRKSLAVEAEAKPVTPSRRSARIKSNTSIVSETLSMQATDSPRAKRAARRNSQAGSDNEGPATPARQTRKTRKDSASSVENQESMSQSSLPVAEMVIEEEPENEDQKPDNISKSSFPTSAADELSPNSARKSKRLLEKNSRKSGSHNSDHDCSTCSVDENKNVNVSTTKKKASPDIESQSRSPLRSDKSKESNESLSESNMSLLKKLDSESILNTPIHNKSVSLLDTDQNDRSKRNRTESWPTVRTPVADDSVNFSDNEVSKKRKQKTEKYKSLNTSIGNASHEVDKSDPTINEKSKSQSILDLSLNRKKNRNETSVEANDDISKSELTDTSMNERNTSQSVLDTSTKRKKKQSETSINASDDTSHIDKTHTGNNEKKSSQPVLDTSKQSEIFINASDDTPQIDKTDTDNIEKNTSQSVLATSTKRKKKQSETSINASDGIPQIDKTDTSINEKNTSQSVLDTSTKQKKKQSETSINASDDTPQIGKTDTSINEKNTSQSVLDTSTKRKKKQSETSINASDDNPQIDKTDTSIHEKNTSQSVLDTSAKRKKKQSETSINASDDTPLMNKTDSSVNEKNISQPFLDTNSKPKKRQSETAKPEDVPVRKILQGDNISNTDTPTEKSGNTNIGRDIAMLLGSAPGNVQAVYFEDSDSNSVGTRTADKIMHLDSEDQCVPVVKHDFQENLSPKDPTEKSAFSNQVDNYEVSCNDIPKVVDNGGNNSCEPMDIDESINEEILQKSLEISQLSKKDRKSVSLSKSATNIEKTDNSKRKSSISNTDTLDRSKDENKSTLILSQIKDVSSTTENTKSPTQINEVLSKTDVNHENDNNKISKGNLSLNDLKGTPKQKALQKLTMQTSTPIITQKLDVKMKTDKENLSAKLSKSNFTKSINDAEFSGDESGSDDENKLLDDEAEEAKDDYESGDSQDEEERRYAAENEIMQRGETLTSDEDISNDTDYDKDSFIVSSDAEDDELLSGSGDDLSMSDNELSMSKKSKKKFNERKEKEQKKASREMFESRHKLNTSDQKSPAKIKKNRMRIDSSLLASDEEVVIKPKKNNRMRLDSTVDTSVQHDDTNVSQNKSKKKNKSMQDSTHDTSIKLDQITNDLDKSKKNKSKRESTTIDEKEITVCNQSSIDNKDPLLIPVKKEPMTPQKDINISVVQFTDRQEIENVHMSENISIVNQTGTDPLDATNAYHDSDSSESEEIMQNYDSVLNELNKDTKRILKNNNISLVTGNETKKNRVEPIIDQLNLTLTKKTKKNNNSKDVLKPKTAIEKKQDSDKEDSSSSIDLQLLFSEDNCGSEDEVTTKPKEDKAGEDEEIFIPLKKSSGKTNIRESIGMNISQKDTTLNESAKKKKKRKSSLGPAESIEEQDICNKSKDVNVSLNESGMKKNKKNSISEHAVEGVQDICIKDANVSLNESVTKKKKKPSTSDPVVEEAKLEIANAEESVLNESSKKKKKKRKSSSAQDTESAEGELFFIDTAGTLGDKENEIEELNAGVTPKSEKKKKKLAQKLEKLVRDEDSDGAPDEAPYNSVKATDAGQQNIENETAETGSNKKKKKKQKKTNAAFNQSGQSIETEHNIPSNSKKRKRKSSNAEASHGSGDVQDKQETGLGNEVVGRHKKRKMSHNEESIASLGVSESKHLKKNKKNHDIYFQATVSALETTEAPEEKKKSKKRKHRDEDGDSNLTKVTKKDSIQDVHVPRLADNILNQLDDDKPGKSGAAKVISTTNFVVENARRKRAKPSNYLEQSVYLGFDSPMAKNPHIKKPKVLPFIPTASISDSGFTTNFKINKLSQVTTFEAEPVHFSKETYLQNKKIKRLGTYEKYKKQIHRKMSKF